MSSGKGPLRVPALILAADHRARGVVTIEPYHELCAALGKALVHCDGLLASVQPLEDLRASGSAGPGHRCYLSLNRTGLAGSVFELDDRLVTTVRRAAESGLDGVKHMTRIDLSSPLTSEALELLGKVLEEARRAGLEAMVEAVSWRDGAMSRRLDDVVLAAVVAHDMGAPLLKVPVPEARPGRDRVSAVGRVVASVGAPVLFLGGPRRAEGREGLLAEALDVMRGGAGGLAIGRSIYQDPDPGGTAQAIAEIVHAASP